MQVVHTAGVPPNHGRIKRAISGWTRNSRNAPVKIVSPNATIERANRTASPAPWQAWAVARVAGLQGCGVAGQLRTCALTPGNDPYTGAYAARVERWLKACCGSGGSGALQN